MLNFFHMNFFVLGSHPALSIAEIATILGPGKDYSKASKEILLLDDVDQTPEVLQERLAGTVKIGSIVGEVKKINQAEVADLIVSLIPAAQRSADRADDVEAKRISYGISTYSCGAPINELAGEGKRLGMAVKKRLKENGLSSRFVSCNTSALTTAAVTGEKLLETGGEFVLIAMPGKILIGQTRTVQDFVAWSNRDYGRPKRDTKSGMLPPKLARMMINLSRADVDKATILDPFCGSGTVLMEAVLMGFQHVIGSDISEKAIEDTRANLDWLDQNEDGDIKVVRLLTKSVETLKEDLKQNVEAVVGETYLGPPLSDRETPARIKKIMDELTQRTASALMSVRHLLKSGGLAVIAIPAFQSAGQVQYLPTAKIIQDAGFKITKVLPESLPNELKIRTPAGGLLYARKEQRVGREILVLKV
jgi:tRNA G10  N-methylase Trm11